MEAVPRRRQLTGDSGWRVIRAVGDAGVVHATDPEPVRSATFQSVDRPTYVFGSTQPDSSVEARVAQSLGIHRVRRRSGGAGVLLMPGEFVWLDLVIPSDDPLWSDDVADAMRWAGGLWQRALDRLGVATERHEGSLVTTQWSAAVCFTGRGAGELLMPESSAKVVGISQRRTRHWARVQTMCHLRWRPELMAALTAAPRPTAAELARAVAAVAIPAEQLERELLAEIDG